MTNKTKTNRNKFYGIYKIEICLDKNHSFFVCLVFCDLSVVYIWATPNKVTPNEIQFEANENYFQIMQNSQNFELNPLILIPKRPIFRLKFSQKTPKRTFPKIPR